jgi:hypothetical protein
VPGNPGTLFASEGTGLRREAYRLPGTITDEVMYNEKAE